MISFIAWNRCALCAIMFLGLSLIFISRKLSWYIFSSCFQQKDEMWQRKGLDIPFIKISSPYLICILLSVLCLPNSEHLCATGGAYTLSSRLPILHGDRLGAFHLLLGSAFHAIGLNHSNSPPLLLYKCLDNKVYLL